MIDIRETFSQTGKIGKILAATDIFWDYLDMEDYFCSNVQDFQANRDKIGLDRKVLFKWLNFGGLNENRSFSVGDQTGKIDVRLIQDIHKTDEFFDRFNPASSRKRLNALVSGTRIYDACVIEKSNGIYVLGFKTESPEGPDSCSDKNYLGLRFPQLVPAL